MKLSEVVRQQAPLKLSQVQPTLDESPEAVQQFNQAVEAQPSVPQQAGNVAMEAVAGFNRSLLGLADIVGPNTIAAVGELVGKDLGVDPQFFTKTFGEERGAFAGDGLATDIAATAGELTSLGGVTGLALKGAGKLLPAATTGESALIGSARQVAQTAPASEAALGGVSGVGQEVGRELGGETGALVGGVVAPLGAAGIFQVLRPKFGVNTPKLIDETTGAPTKQFEVALRSRGLKFGDIIEEPELLPRVTDDISPKQIVDRIAKVKIKEGSKSGSLAPLRLEGDKVIPDDLAKFAVKQGFRPGDVQIAKQANNPTKKRLKEMLSRKRAILADSTKSIESRPLDVAGDELVTRVGFIRNRLDKLNTQLDDLASKPAREGGLVGLKVDAGAIEKTVLDRLRGLTVNIPDDVARNTTKLKAHLSKKGAFVGSDISKDRSAQKTILDVVDVLGETTRNDAARAHQLKRVIDGLVDYRKASAIKLTPKGEQFAKGVRGELNDIVRQRSDDYAQLNDGMSTALKTIGDLENSLTNKISLLSTDKETVRLAGQELRKIESNYASGPELLRAVKQVDDTAKSYGGEFKVTLTDLVQFNNVLDDRFGATARGAFQGQIEQAIKQGARGTRGLEELAIDVAAKTVGKKFGPDEEKALNAMQRILSRELQ